MTLDFEEANTKLVDIDVLEVKDRVADRLVTADSFVTAFHSLLFSQNSELPCSWHF